MNTTVKELVSGLTEDKTNISFVGDNGQILSWVSENLDDLRLGLNEPHSCTVEMSITEDLPMVVVSGDEDYREFFIKDLELEDLDEYKFEPNGSYPLSNSGGLQVSIDESTETVKVKLITGERERPMETFNIETDQEGEHYFIWGELTIYLNEIMKIQ